MTRVALASLAGVAAALALAAAAPASDTTLRAALATWSRKVGADARSVSLAAQRRHPRRMAYSANRFRRDALRARAALAAQQPSSAKGTKAKQLALSAFSKYASAGSLWASSGNARLKKQRASASGWAKRAAAAARAGNAQLLAASRLLR